MYKDTSPHSLSSISLQLKLPSYNRSANSKSYSQLPKDEIMISNADRSTLASSKYSTINNYSSSGKFKANSYQGKT